jgi:hypothetical protein
MAQHQQQVLFLGAREGGLAIELGIAGWGAEEGVKGGRDRLRFRWRGVGAIGQQAAIERPETVLELGQTVALLVQELTQQPIPPVPDSP